MIISVPLFQRPNNTPPPQISVTESGTEAAAGSITSIKREHADPQRVTFDRPFIFILYDKCNNLILFQGRCSDPDWETTLTVWGEARSQSGTSCRFSSCTHLYRQWYLPHVSLQSVELIVSLFVELFQCRWHCFNNQRTAYYTRIYLKQQNRLGKWKIFSDPMRTVGPRFTGRIDFSR